MTFSDFEFEQSVNLIYVPPATSDEDVLLSRALASELVVTDIMQLRRDIAKYGPTPAAGGSGSYKTHLDMVTLEFNTADAGKWPITLVGPSSAIFNADTETVNENNADVIAFVDWCIEFAKTNSGVALISFNRGWRWKAPE